MPVATSRCLWLSHSAADHLLLPVATFQCPWPTPGAPDHLPLAVPTLSPCWAHLPVPPPAVSPPGGVRVCVWGAGPFPPAARARRRGRAHAGGARGAGRRAAGAGRARLGSARSGAERAAGEDGGSLLRSRPGGGRRRPPGFPQAAADHPPRHGLGKAAGGGRSAQWPRTGWHRAPCTLQLLLAPCSPLLHLAAPSCASQPLAARSPFLHLAAPSCALRPPAARSRLVPSCARCAQRARHRAPSREGQPHAAWGRPEPTGGLGGAPREQGRARRVGAATAPQCLCRWGLSKGCRTGCKSGSRGHFPSFLALRVRERRNPTASLAQLPPFL